MAITYANLITKIRNYTEVDSNVLTDAIVDEFILDTEAKIYRDVDADYNRKFVLSNFVAGKRYINLPIDLQVLRSVQHIASSGTRTFLEKRDTSFMGEYNPTDATGTPKYYAMWNESDGTQYISLAPVPSAGDQKKTTTYLSTKAPDLLFYGCMVQAYGFLKGPMDMYNLYQNKYNQEIQAFTLEQTGRRRRGEYVDGVPRVKVPSPSP